MTKVLTYGTFDLFHHGHYNILKRAKELGDYLIVGVTGESYDLERGKINVRDSLLTRVENVKKTGFADEIIIEEYQGQKIDDIIKYEIDIFVVGSDWSGKFDYLKKYCEVKYLERTKNISSTQIRERNDLYRIGICTDSTNDNGIILETKYVSGIHVDSVYSQDDNIANSFKEKYELNKSYCDYSLFLKDIDIVYIKSNFENRQKLVELAICQNKYIIVDAPITLDVQELNRLFSLARQNKVLLIENIIPAYLRAFNQLVWLVNGGLIGRVLGISANICYEDFPNRKNFFEMLIYPLLITSKLIQTDNYKVSYYKSKVDEHSLYHQVMIGFKDTVVSIIVGDGIRTKSELQIYGQNGQIKIPNDWWNTGYFEAEINSEKNIKRYSFNFEGNGFRYLLQELLIMIREKREECTRIFNEESIQFVKMINEII